MRDRWIIHRAGLINFWYYDDEVFDFIDGRLLLRGANGSGKSVTMQSFIPLLLDGNKSPERLDPFGSRARRLEDYLLGEESLSNYSERTGYLYLEFKKQYTENHLTIGMGLKARRGQAMDFWGFTLLDGRRVGVDFYLYKHEIGENGVKQKVPLTKRELKQRVLPGGEVVETQREYMEMVNKHVFGFDTIEEYDDLIKLLIQLRSPKLSKDFKPTVIYDIMNGALPALSDEDLRPLSETIENMDEIKVHLDELYRCHQAASKLKEDYDNYNRFILHEKTRELLKSHRELEVAEHDRKELEGEIKRQSDSIEELARKLSSLEAEQGALLQKEEQLRENDAFKAQQALLEREKDLQEGEKTSRAKREQLLSKESRYKAVGHQAKVAANEKETLELHIESILKDLEITADLAGFMEHHFSKDELKKAFGGKFDFTYWRTEAKKYRYKLRKALKALKDVKEENLRYDRTLQEQEAIKQQRDRLERDVREWQRQFDSIKGEFVQGLYRWSEQNRELNLEKRDLEAVSRMVLNYGEGTNFEDILAEVRRRFEDKSQRLQGDLYELKNQRDLRQIAFDAKRAELEEWKNKKDPEPERDPQVEENRKRLAAKGIPHLPFYKAVEFKQDLDEEAKGSIEAALEDMGLMDALIISQKHLGEALAMDENMSDKYITPGVFDMKLNVLEFFDIPKSLDEDISREIVDDVLRNILIYHEANATYVEEDGTFGIGVLQGKGRSGVKSRFIGYESRKRFREEMMATLQGELQAIEEDLKSLDEKIRWSLGRLDTLKGEYHAMPSNDDLEEAFQSCRSAMFHLEHAEQRLSEKNQEVGSRFESLQKLRAVARELTSGTGLGGDIDTYEAALEHLEDYDGDLGQLEISYSRMLSLIGNIKILEHSLEGMDMDIENLTGEIRKIGEHIFMIMAQIQSLEDTLRTLGLEQLKDELRSCAERLKALPGEIREADRQCGITAERMQKNTERLLELENGITHLKQIYHLYREGFKDEVKLDFVWELQDLGETPEEDEDIVKHCQRALKVLTPLLDGLKTDREKVSNRLRDSFHENHDELINYGLALGYLFDSSAMEEPQPLQEYYTKLRRYQITAHQQGKAVSLYALYEALGRDIAASEALLKETDRQLFEEIIMHNVGKKIRAKIFRAEGWVEKMNQLMTERDTSSGINFSLAWRPIPAETEQELDTRQLVNILKSSAQMLKPEDFNLVTEHFRSKVDRARKLMDEANNMETFHLIIKEVLDYRQWFEFKLYFRKEGEHRRELTNHAFDRLSGGEKAMAMYIPLFSAVYARYDAASLDAPRLISLDEAFAGVDDINIRDMFKLVEDLKFNFIINSQVLWGDYDTVPGLSICELVRPKNANFVTVIRYLWDGEKRMLAYNYDIDEEIAASRS